MGLVAPLVQVGFVQPLLSKKRPKLGPESADAVHTAVSFSSALQSSGRRGLSSSGATVDLRFLAHSYSDEVDTPTSRARAYPLGPPGVHMRRTRFALNSSEYLDGAVIIDLTPPPEHAKLN